MQYMTSQYGIEVQEQRYFLFRPKGAGPGVKRSKGQISCVSRIWPQSIYDFPIWYWGARATLFFIPSPGGGARGQTVKRSICNLPTLNSACCKYLCCGFREVCVLVCLRNMRFVVFFFLVYRHDVVKKFPEKVFLVGCFMWFWKCRWSSLHVKQVHPQFSLTVCDRNRVQSSLQTRVFSCGHFDISQVGAVSVNFSQFTI
jgi:hypothetical protein